MSVDRIWRWVCDDCKVVAERYHSGLPRGWIFVKAARITHRCPECAESVPKDRRGYPKVIAEK